MRRYHGQKIVKGLYHGDTRIKAMYKGDELIWRQDWIDATIRGNTLVIMTQRLAWQDGDALVLQPNNLSVATINNETLKISGHGSI